LLIGDRSSGGVMQLDMGVDEVKEIIKEDK